jgi:hypothetical protein
VVHQSFHPAGIEGPIFLMLNLLKCHICHFLVGGSSRMLVYSVAVLGEWYGIS